MNLRDIEALGEPSLEIAGLRLWVHGRQFPNAEDYWDGNWLRITAYCLHPNSAVRTSGSLVHLGEIVGLLRGCQRLHREMKGSAALECIEPNLKVQFHMEWNGHIKVNIEITPDPMTERHSFDDELDQSHLPGIVEQCLSILERYPVREPQSLPAASDA